MTDYATEAAAVSALSSFDFTNNLTTHKLVLSRGSWWIHAIHGNRVILGEEVIAPATVNGDAFVSNPLSQFASTTSAQLAGVLSDETGTGAAVFAESPTLVTPALGTPASGVATNLTGTATGLTSGITNALKSATSTVDVSAATAPTNGQVLQATSGTTATWQTIAGGDALVGNPLSQFAATTSAQLAGVITDETGTGSLVFSDSPALVTPDIGTPSAGVATNLTGTAASLTAGTATVANGLKSATTTVSVSAATAPTTGQVLKATSGTAATWQDESTGGSPEGTSVLSTGETGGTKYLREDGDGSSSWQPVTASVASLNDVTDVTITANSSGETLIWNGSAWVNQTLAEAGIQAAGSYITASSTDTLTNKTFDANGTGNSLSNVDLASDVIGLLPTANIADEAVTHAKLAHVVTSSILGRATAATGDVETLTAAQVKTILALVQSDITTSVNAQTGTTYTGVIGDAGKVITMTNAAANTFTIPANSSVAYPIGTQIHIKQGGAGATTVAITTDTLNVNANLTKVLNGQHAYATCIKETSTTWTIFGNLVAA